MPAGTTCFPSSMLSSSRPAVASAAECNGVSHTARARVVEFAASFLPLPAWRGGSDQLRDRVQPSCYARRSPRFPVVKAKLVRKTA